MSGVSVLEAMMLLKLAITVIYNIILFVVLLRFPIGLYASCKSQLNYVFDSQRYGLLSDTQFCHICWFY